MILMVLCHTLEAMHIPALCFYLEYGKSCQATYGNVCLDALYLTIRKFCMGQGLQYYSCAISHTALLPLLLLILPLGQQIYHNGTWSRVASSSTFSCFFLIFFSRNWIFLVSVKSHETEVTEVKLLWFLLYNIPSA